MSSLFIDSSSSSYSRIEEEILNKFFEINENLGNISAMLKESHQRETLIDVKKALENISENFKRINQSRSPTYTSFCSSSSFSGASSSFASSSSSSSIFGSIPLTDHLSSGVLHENIKLEPLDLFTNILKNLPKLNVQDENILEVIIRLRDVMSLNFRRNVTSLQHYSLWSSVKISRKMKLTYQDKSYFSLCDFLGNTYSLITDEPHSEIIKHNSEIIFQKILKKLSEEAPNDQIYIYQTLSSLLDPITNHFHPRTLNSVVQELKSLKEKILSYNSKSSLTHKDVIDLTKNDGPSDLENEKVSSHESQTFRTEAQSSIQKIINLISELKICMGDYKKNLEEDREYKSPNGFVIIKSTYFEKTDKKIASIIKDAQLILNPPSPMASPQPGRRCLPSPMEIANGFLPPSFSSELNGKIFNFAQASFEGEKPQPSQRRVEESAKRLAKSKLTAEERKQKRNETRKRKRAKGKAMENEGLLEFLEEEIKRVEGSIQRDKDLVQTSKANESSLEDQTTDFLNRTLISLKKLIDNQSDPISRKMILHYIYIVYSLNSTKKAAIIRAFQDLGIENNDTSGSFNYRSTLLFGRKFREHDSDLFTKVSQILKNESQAVKDGESHIKVKKEILKKIDEHLVKEKSIISRKATSSSSSINLY
ncbi:MAG: hypothetical protein K1060chlam3_00148 [Candidatus Anoxychlamydiales bacterium]|nr:hypothetical protein [Candidatus Anoxychlamydiales bacterium]